MSHAIIERISDSVLTQAKTKVVAGSSEHAENKPTITPTAWKYHRTRWATKTQ